MLKELRERAATRHQVSRSDAVLRAREERLAKQAAVMDQIKAMEESCASGQGFQTASVAFPEVKFDLKTEMERLRNLRRHTSVRRCMTLVSVALSAFIQSYAIQAFVNPANLLSSGFTGLAILIDRITALSGFTFPTFAGMVVLNIPVALLSWKSISRRFVVFSMIQVCLASLFLRLFTFQPILDNLMLQVVFGGFLYGLSIAVALRGGASTAGTDFISLMVSNKTGRSIWGLIFAGNCAVLVIFGAMFGWEPAAYSIIFQFISTKTIETFYHRYDRVTLQIITQRPKQILDAYNKVHRHGSSVMEVMGGRSKQRYWLVNTVVSSYEVDDVMQLIRLYDGSAVVNVFRTENFFGNFYRAPID
jgi:uncharacterized membrane-anchored protein YitT (DUF2179 family)